MVSSYVSSIAFPLFATAISVSDMELPPLSQEGRAGIRILRDRIRSKRWPFAGPLNLCMVLALSPPPRPCRRAMAPLMRAIEIEMREARRLGTMGTNGPHRRFTFGRLRD
jgi:hypothetical protein